jgi:hypothetical protein
MNAINYEIIQQYLHGELAGDALKAFEKELQTNTALANEVALFKTIDTDLAAQLKDKKEKQALTATLQNLNQVHFKKNSTRKIFVSKRWWYAATAAAAAIILIFIFKPGTAIHFNNEEVFATYLNKDIDTLSFEQRGSNDSALINAATLFNKKKYTEALPLLQSITLKDSSDMQLTLATGFCYMQTSQANEALHVFNRISQGNSVFKYKAQWYTALVYLKQNKLNECVIALQALPKDADEYENAADLIKKIQKK